jgi:dTDP-4-dehydrorhamnose reductase
MKILLTGGSGRLGSEILKRIDCFAPTHQELDITNFDNCKRIIEKYDPDVIIHSAAWRNLDIIEASPEKCFEVNVLGTESLIKLAKGRRFIYISSDRVFKDNKPRPDEVLTPSAGNYGWTKAMGEFIVRQYPNTQIIRFNGRSSPEVVEEILKSLEPLSNTLSNIVRISIFLS